MKSVLSVFVLLIIVISSRSTSAAVISVVPFTNAADSGISTTNNYTHKVDLGPFDIGGMLSSTGGTNVNGVNFIDSGTVGANYTLSSGQAVLHIPYLLATDGLEKMYASGYSSTSSGVQSVNITGLTAGTAYSARFYSGSLDDTDSAPIQISAVNGNDPEQPLNYDASTGGTLHYIRYDYIATANSINVTFLPQAFLSPTNGFNLYAFSNQVATSTPEPSVLGLAALGMVTLVRRR